MKTIVALTGASGSVYGTRLLQVLPGHKTVIVSDDAAAIAEHETGMGRAEIEALGDEHYQNSDLAAPISSGSVKFDAMVIATATDLRLPLVQLAVAHGLPVFSPATFVELETRLWRPKFDRYLNMELRQRILHDASAAALWVDIPPELAAQNWSRDPDDDHFVRAALAAEASWLVSGDRDLLDIEPPAELRILTPAAAAAEPLFCA